MEQEQDPFKSKSEVLLQSSSGFRKVYSSCGYCKKAGKRKCGFRAKQMTVVDYRKLLDRGFRRCGNYYYKVDLFDTCCLWYTIRSVAPEHKMRKSHKKIWRKWEEYLKGERNLNGSLTKTTQKSKGNSNHGNIEISEFLSGWLASKFIAIKEVINQTQFLNEGCSLEIEVDQGNSVKWSKNYSSKEKDGYSSNLFKKIFGKNRQKFNLTLFEFLVHEEGGLKLVDLLGTSISFGDKNAEISVGKKGAIIFQFESSEVSNNAMIEEEPKQTEKLQPKSFRTEIVEADFTDEKFSLYKRYLAGVHKDKDIPTKSGLKRFLCTKNLINQTIKSENSDKFLKLGCYHLNYYVDDKLIAVGVIDILDNGLSTVYCYYEPSYRDLQFGVVSALYELEWIRKQKEYFPKFKYYYLGFYISDCLKMNYKADYEPIELLCPKSMEYIRLTKELKQEIIEGKRIQLKDSILTEEASQLNPQLFFSSDLKLRKTQILEKGKVKNDGSVYSFSQLQNESQDYLIENYAELFENFGPDVMESVVWN